MRILCVGVSHKTAPVAMREKIAFDHSCLDAALEQLRLRWPGAEFLLLSTCNRTELYTVRPLHGHPREIELIDWLAEFHSQDLKKIQAMSYGYSGTQAVEQLLRVAAGLDSLVIGEVQIVAQIKSALAVAQEACVSGAVITALVETALHTAKHVRNETGIGDGKASVASVALDIILDKLSSLAGKNILSIGAGKMNEMILKHLCNMQPGRLMITNRSADKADDWAKLCGGEFCEFAKLANHIKKADVVVTATGSPRPVISAEMIADTMAVRAGQPLLLVDLAVPHDIDPDVAGIENVTLCNMDTIEKIVQATLRERKENFQQAEQIINEHVCEFMENMNVREVAPVIEALYYKVENIIREELADAENKFSTHDDAKQDLEILQRSLRRALRKFCHPAAENLRVEASTTPGGIHAEIVKKLFALDNPEINQDG